MIAGCDRPSRRAESRRAVGRLRQPGPGPMTRTLGPAGRDGAGTAPVEVELKLALDAQAMEQALASPVLRERVRGDVTTRELRNVYYDTPDRRLHARKAVLRV